MAGPNSVGRISEERIKKKDGRRMGMRRSDSSAVGAARRQMLRVMTVSIWQDEGDRKRKENESMTV